MLKLSTAFTVTVWIYLHCLLLNSIVLSTWYRVVHLISSCAKITIQFPFEFHNNIFIVMVKIKSSNIDRSQHKY